MIPVSVVVVTHNHASLLRRCLESVRAEVAPLGGEILVIDNRSDDGSADVARRLGIRVEVNERRRGLAANANRGMALAGGRHLVVLNPDTEVLAGALSTLVRFLDEHPRVGLCGPRLVHPDGRVQPSARRFPGLGTFLVRRTPLRVLLRGSALDRRHLMADVDLTAPTPVDWVLGACLCVRREAIASVGPFDEGFFLYVEEIDWARRMANAGWQVYLVPDAQVIHHHQAASDRRLLGWHSWVHARSMVRYARKHMLPQLPGLAIREDDNSVWRATRRASSDRND